MVLSLSTLSPFLYYAIIAGLSFMSSLFLLWAVCKLWRRFGIMDRPERYGHNRFPVPYAVGVILFLNLLVFSPFLFQNEIHFKRFLIIFIFWAVLTLISFLDDLDTISRIPFKISPKFRLFIQIFTWFIIGLTSIKIWYISNIFWGITFLDYFIFPISLPPFLEQVIGPITFSLIPLIFTVTWFVLVFNAVNWSDGVPWLTSWLSTITLFIILILTIKLTLVDTTTASQQNSEFVLLLLSVVLPTSIILWIADFRPRVLMGDSGTMMLGFFIATMAIVAGGKIATVTTVLGVYLIDALFVIFLRIFNKQNPLKWDRTNHLHYRLRNIGISENYIRAFVYSLSLLFGISAVFMTKEWKIILFVILAIIVIFVTKIFSIITMFDAKKISLTSSGSSPSDAQKKKVQKLSKADESKEMNKWKSKSAPITPTKKTKPRKYRPK